MKKTQSLLSCDQRWLMPWAVGLVALFFSFSLFSQDATPKNEPNVAPPATASVRPMISTGMGAEAIARNQPDAAVWLMEDNENRTLALFQPEQDSPAKGAILILANEGQSPASGIAGALRQPLSRSGWAVMTLGLPKPPFAVQHWLQGQSNQRPVPEGQDEAEAGGDKDPAAVKINVKDTESPREALTQYRDQIIAALTAAVDALQEREYERIVLAGVGRAAGHVTRQAREDGRASDLVWIAAFFHGDESEQLADLLTEAASPSILELYSTFTADEVIDRNVRERAAALERAGIAGYRRQPVAMARQPKPREARMLASRISAWLVSEPATR